jgi:hypothetical protein
MIIEQARLQTSPEQHHDTGSSPTRISP